MRYLKNLRPVSHSLPVWAAICLLVSLFSMESMADETVTWRQYYDAVDNMMNDLRRDIASGDAEPLKCATPIYIALRAMQPKGVESLSLYYGREDTMSFTHGTDHFLIHYTDNGPNRVYEYDVQTLEPGVPDYVYKAGLILDSVWTHTVDELGFVPPISDGYYNGGGDGRQDVYLVDFAAYGVTVQDSIYEVFPTLTTTTYMFLENDYQGFPGYESNRLDAFRVTAAHEFFHCVQFAIDANEIDGSAPNINTAWLEMTAVFMEEEHYDGIDDYLNYLPYFYEWPQWSLRTGTVLSSPQINIYRNLHMYASVIFPIYLSEVYGSGIIREIWERCGDVAGSNWVSATDAAIAFASGDTWDLRRAFREFTLWNLFTGSWARSGEYFSEAANYPQAERFPYITSYPATINASDSLRPDNLGANYIVLSNLDSAPEGLTVQFDGDRTQPWGMHVVGLPANVGDIGEGVYVDGTGFDSSTVEFDISYAQVWDKIALIPMVLDGDEIEVSYQLTVDYASDVDEGSSPRPLDYSLSQNRPNPFNPETVIEYTLPQRGAVRIKVVNSLGQTVRMLVDGMVTMGRHRVVWDGCDSDGNIMPSGVYLYTIEADTYRESKAMVLLR